MTCQSAGPEHEWTDMTPKRAWNDDLLLNRLEIRHHLKLVRKQAHTLRIRLCQMTLPALRTSRGFRTAEGLRT